MSRLTYLNQEPELPDGHGLANQHDFFILYDRYAPALFGVITEIISDKAEALAILETTFTKVRSEIDLFNAEKQPIFIWLLTIARRVASDALKARKQVLSPVFQITTSGKVVDSQTSTVAVPTLFDTTSTDGQLKELLDSVLFKNCTPEEAATSIGIPLDRARQQLRLAMQQLRTLPKP